MSNAALAVAPGNPAADEAAVESVGDASRAEWDAYVDSRADGAAYHRYGWRNVVRRAFRRETHYLAVRRSSAAGARGAITGILPLTRLKSVAFGDFMVSLPFFNYGGVLADTPDDARLLLDAAQALGRRLGVTHIELRHAANVFPAEPQRTDKVSMILRLPKTSEELWKSFHSKVRAQVRRPEREGAVAASGGAELLDDFYTVFTENMRDLGTPVYSRELFASILAEFPQSARIFVVRVKDVPVAGGFVVGHGDMLEIPWASSLRSANAIGVNMLLYWRILEFACASGFARFDFGRCTLESGTYKFKKQWGAEPLQLHWHYWLRSGGEPPVLNHSNAKYRLAIAAWQKLPLAVANRLGPVLARNLP